jgi:hypothetical protein
MQSTNIEKQGISNLLGLLSDWRELVDVDTPSAVEQASQPVLILPNPEDIAPGAVIEKDD